MPHSRPKDAYQVPLAALGPFLLITFGLAWGVFVLFWRFPAAVTALFGPVSGQHPLFILAVYAPAIAAFSLTLYYGGWRGWWRYLSRLGRWQCPPAWYGFLLVGIPLIYYGGAAMKGDVGIVPPPVTTGASLVAALGLTLMIGPVEEFGWRGVALPLLQRQFSPFGASLMLGLIWGVWHLPAFWLSGTPQHNWSFLPFLLGAIAISVIVTPLFNASGGSILLPLLFHFQLNNPLWPDGQPYDMFFFVAAAALIAWWHRRTLFQRPGQAVTAVIPPTV